ncbi:MAG: S9 family peptidase [Planctomycetes bacterium]|nr:S9 family peptidase [Planctomycetota bacterium]
MKTASSRIFRASLLALVTLIACQASTKGFRYPSSPRCDQVDVFHGREVADPYRWLEEDSKRTRRWIEAQNKLALGFLQEIPELQAIQERLSELWNYERYELPVQKGEYTFYRRNDGLQNHSVLYVSGPDGERVLFDPNDLSEDGTVALASYRPSPSGRFVALGISDGGSDWRTWRVVRTASGTEFPDLVTHNKFGGVQWAEADRGFFYSHYERPGLGTELQAKNTRPDIFFHSLGALENSDVKIMDRPEDERYGAHFQLTDDRRGLVVTRYEIKSRKTELELLILPSTGPVTAGDIKNRPPGENLIQLVSGYDAQHRYVSGVGHRHWILTDLDASRRRVVEIDARKPQREFWKELIPEASDTIRSVSAVAGHIIVNYMQDASSRIHVFNDEGRLVCKVPLPGLGTVSGFGGEWNDATTYFSFTSQTTPGSIYRYEPQSAKIELYRKPGVAFDPEDYTTEQVFYPSLDGTRVPMFLTYKKGLERSGDNPTYLYGYGGFNISLTPRFSLENLVWMEMGGLLAIPNLRGGGEYGEEWHEAGTKLKKQNVFDDFVAAAEWLTRNGYTNPEQLAIGGGSNGGLLVGACMTQRPELFSATLPRVGVHDMLRYHLFTIGWAWARDYGTVDDQEEFEALLAYSPLHNTRPGTKYPSTLITTADHDDRVVPAHSFKFAAALQGSQGGDQPILIRIETRAGHGAGKPTVMRIEEAAQRWAFLVNELDMNPRL